MEQNQKVVAGYSGYREVKKFIFEAVFYVITGLTNIPIIWIGLQVGLEKERTIFLF